MFDVKKIREDFPILETTVYNKPLIYLDNAATAQKPRQVIEKVNFLHSNMNANVHRGVHYMSSTCTSEYEIARERVRDFIHAKSTKSIVFTSGATASINLVANSWGNLAISKGDQILISEMEHHSNIVPWQMLCERTGAVLKVVPFNINGELDLTVYGQLLTDKVKLVAVTGASNVLGTMPDVNRMCAMAHSVGSKFLVDACQSIVHSHIDVTDMDCDFLVFSGHKLYAPTGIGVLYAKEELLEAMPPFMGGGDMVASVSFEKTTYADIPLKFEAGTSNFIGAIALGEAIAYLSSINRRMAEVYEKELLTYASEGLSSIDELRIYGTLLSKCPIISFSIEGIHPLDLGMILDKQGIAIRTGTHCAEPIMTHYGVTGMSRVSLAMYNTEQEIDALVDGVAKAVKMLK